MTPEKKQLLILEVDARIDVINADYEAGRISAQQAMYRAVLLFREFTERAGEP